MTATSRTRSLDVLRTQHRSLQQRLASIQTTGDLLEAVEDVVAHLLVHRRVLAPASRLFSSDLARLERRMRLLLLRLVALSRLGSSRLEETLGELAQAFDEHVAIEEQLVLPDLESSCDAPALAALARRVARVHEESRARVAALRLGDGLGAPPQEDVDCVAE